MDLNNAYQKAQKAPRELLDHDFVMRLIRLRGNAKILEELEVSARRLKKAALIIEQMNELMPEWDVLMAELYDLIGIAGERIIPPYLEDLVKDIRTLNNAQLRKVRNMVAQMKASRMPVKQEPAAPPAGTLDGWLKDRALEFLKLEAAARTINTVAKIRQGIILIGVKNSTPEGKWMEWLKAVGIGSSTAAHLMKAASVLLDSYLSDRTNWSLEQKSFEEIPGELLDLLKGVRWHILRELIYLDPEVIRRVLEHGIEAEGRTIPLAQATVAQVRTWVRSYQARQLPDASRLEKEAEEVRKLVASRLLEDRLEACRIAADVSRKLSNGALGLWIKAAGIHKKAFGEMVRIWERFGDMPRKKLAGLSYTYLLLMIRLDPETMNRVLEHGIDGRPLSSIPTMELRAWIGRYNRNRRRR